MSANNYKRPSIFARSFFCKYFVFFIIDKDI
ncbi:hypothetical protein ZYGNAAKF_CDS0014 [Enterococcus phage VRE9_2]